MAEYFNNRINYNDLTRLSMLSVMGDLSPDDQNRLLSYKEKWNFFEGFHWENIPQDDRPQITENYCRAFVNKFVAFEMGLGFNIKFPVEDDASEETGTPTTDYVNNVWKDNKKLRFCIEFGQMKSVTGDSWVQVKFEKAGSFNDPYAEYPKGRIRVISVPSDIAFPEYDTHDKDRLKKLTIAYPIEREERSPILKKSKLSMIVYKQVWTDTTIEIWEGNDMILSVPNQYGVIPYVYIPNYPIAGRTNGMSDLEDLIPLNVELNVKKSDVSEIIDYHSAPVTIVYGAKINSLEKGANKIWGGLPKDSRVENLALNGDLVASNSYIADLKSAMHQIGGVPSGALGGEQAISNTSGVALQMISMPLIERTRVKRMCSSEGLQQVNKLILLISVKEGLYTIPNGVQPKDFYNNEVTFPDPLPKDRLLELQQIQIEMQLGIESRVDAMDRLGKEDVTSYLGRIDKDRKDNPQVYGVQPQQGQLNSGMSNGQTPVETVRKEITGQNGGNNQ